MTCDLTTAYKITELNDFLGENKPGSQIYLQNAQLPKSWRAQVKVWRSDFGAAIRLALKRTTSHSVNEGGTGV